MGGGQRGVRRCATLAVSPRTERNLQDDVLRFAAMVASPPPIPLPPASRTRKGGALPTRARMPSAPEDQAEARARASAASIAAITDEAPASRILRFTWLGLAATFTLVVAAVLTRSPEAVQALEERAYGRSGAYAHPAHDETPATAPPPGETAPEGELGKARLAGIVALAPLAQRYPNDPAVLRALMLAHAGDKAGYAQALTVARRLFEIAPKSAGDEDMRLTLTRILAGPAETAALAAESLTSKMGTFGPDLLYDLATDASAGLARERAGKAMESTELRKAAAPELLIALELKGALPCKRKALFARARAEGDERSLPFLKPLLVTNGCTKMLFVKTDCYECLGNREGLSETVEAIEARARSAEAPSEKR